MQYINGIRKHVGNAPLIMVGSTVLVMNSRNQLLMIKRSDNGSWGVPGGAMELGESTEETAKRELLEETGLEVDKLSLFDVFSGKELYYQYPSGEEVYNVSIVYIAHVSEETILLLDGEHYEAHYFNLTELPENISPPIKPILRRFLEVQK